MRIRILLFSFVAASIAMGVLAAAFLSERVVFAGSCAMFLLLVTGAAVVRQRVLLQMRRLEEALAESGRQRDRSEQVLREFSDSLPALVGYIDRDHFYRFANDKYREWLGLDPAAMIGRHVREVMGADAYEEVRGPLDVAMSGQRVQWSRAVSRDGRDSHLLAEYIPDFGPDGKVRGCHAFTVDITGRREAELRLERSEQRLADLMNAIPALVAYFDMDERCQYVNEAGMKAQGLTPDDLQGTTARDALGAAYAQYEPHVRGVLAGQRVCFEGRVGLHGREAHFQAHLVPDRPAGRPQRGFYVMTFDIAALKEAEARQARSERQLRDITDNLPVMITYIDSDERYRFVNRTGLQWLGRTADEVLGEKVADCVRPALFDARRELLARALAGERVTFDIDASESRHTRSMHCVYLPDVQPDGSVAGLYGLGTDVTALKTIERQLSQLVRSDALTGLANRYQFDEQMPQAIARARRAGAGLALMYLDIDRFKSINDTLGHAAGDAVLHTFAQRLLQSVRGTDTVARLGGDEFVVILEGLAGEAEAKAIANKIIARMAQPIDVEGESLCVTTSIGIAWCADVGFDPQAAPSVRALLARADEALYDAKNAGRNTFRLLAGVPPVEVDVDEEVHS